MIWLLALLLVWDFPQDDTSQLASWLIDYTYAGGGTVEQMTVPPVFCPSRGGYCAQWPGCPDPGIYQFWVQAQWKSGQVSARSNIATCEFTALKPCVCQRQTSVDTVGDVRVAIAQLPPSPQPNLTVPSLPVFAFQMSPAPA